MEPLQVFSRPLRIDNLPPFPTPELLHAVVLPVAPVAPAEAQPDPYYTKLWTTALRRLCGQWPSPPKQISPAAKLCIGQLYALDIPPAAWVLHRYNAFLGSDVPEKLSHPPFGFVYSPNALARELEGPMSWLHQLAVPRTLLTAESRTAIAEWQKLRLQQTSEQEYLRKLEIARQANEQEAKSLLKAIQSGAYVW